MNLIILLLNLKYYKHVYLGKLKIMHICIQRDLMQLVLQMTPNLFNVREPKNMKTKMDTSFAVIVQL